MATWNNLDTLASYEKLAGLKNHVDIKKLWLVRMVQNV